jgi:ribosome-binding factor A
MSHRHEQTESTLKRKIAEVIERGIGDPRIRGLISVTEVDVSPDRKQATVSVSVLPEEHAKLAIAGLQDAAKHIRSQVARSVAMRVMPTLTFRLDQTLKKQAEVFEAIRQGMDREQPREDSDDHKS